MDEPISATDANRRFPALLEGVREGRSFVVTSHGKPVARIVPIRGNEAVSRAAREALLAHLRQQPVIEIGPWTRDELYEDDDE